MIKNRFLKSICLVVLVVISFTNCSSEDSNNSNESNPDLKLKFTLDGFNDYKGEYDELVYWDSTLEKNGTTTYGLNAIIDRKGIDSNENAHVAVIFEFSFTASEPLKAGQVYNISQIDYIDGNFALNNNEPNAWANVCGYLRIEIDNKTIGQIKITSVSGKRISGEFYFTDLHNLYYNSHSYFYPNTATFPNWYEYNKCFDSSIPKYVNISKGEFYNVEIQ